MTRKLTTLLTAILLLSTWCMFPSMAQQQQPCEGFRTQTQGGWGQPNQNPGNPSFYMYANFAGAFPSGVTIGCTNTLKLTTPQAVTAFLPSGTTPSALPAGNLVDPGSSYSNVFAGQVMTLALNLGFDNYDANFGSSPDHLSNLVIASGTFAGWTVQQLFDEANDKIGGCASPYTYSQLNDAVDNVNNNYDDGTSNGGFLICTPPPPPPPVISVTGVGNATCLQLGSVDITVTGGTSPYSYSWNNGATTQDLSGVAGGSYSVTVTDAAGQTASTSVNVIAAASAISLNATSVSPLCFGSFNGSASVSASGGTAPYSYIWSNGKTTSSINNIGAGVYGVTVNDASGCSASTSVSVNQPSKIIVVLACTNTCPEICNGTIFANVSGGTAPYTYEWTNGATTQGIDGLCAGVHWVTVTDANGCKKIAGINIQVIPAIVINGVATNVTCFDACNGSIAQIISGGCPPFTYNWNNGATSEDLSSLCAGSYSVTVTDFKGCTASASYQISQPELLVVDVTPTNPLCYGQFGSATASANGGTLAYSFLWSNGQTGSSASGLAAGAFSVTVTDAHGCTATDGGVIEIPALIVITPSHEDVTCYNACNGSASVSVIGGTGAYSYNWSNGGNTASIDGLCAGSYSVTVYDAHQCSATSEVVIGQPTAVSVSVVKTNVLCFGGNTGTATATAVGGNAPYSYLWSNGATTAEISGLVAGIYSVTATDANGCTASGNVVVGQPDKLQGYANCIKTCPGACNGVASVTIIGGTAPYSYVWSTGATTSSINGLCVGVYWVTVTDANGCQKIIGTQLATYPATTLGGSSTNVTCFEACNGTIDLTVSGGSAPFIYNWSNGASSQDLSGLCAGSYSVTTTDAHGCTATISFVITQPELLTVDVEGISPLCYPQLGSAEAFANGGTAPYTYHWSNGFIGAQIVHLAAGVYTVTVTDANGCTAVDEVEIVVPTQLVATASSSNITCYGYANGTASVEVVGGTAPYSIIWSNGSNNASLTNLAPGTYTVTVYDANQCSATASVEISQPADLNVDVDNTDVTCFGFNNGTASASVSGGTAPYSYLWSNGATTSSISGLHFGLYSVLVTDANGCHELEFVFISAPLPLVAIDISEDVNCYGGNDGSINLIVLGGTYPYSYLWNDGATTQDRNNLVAGSYSVTVTDANGCSTVENETIGQPSLLVATATSVDVTCFDACDGSASVEANGGAGSYSYDWSNGATSSSISGLCAGTYSVTVTDCHGCTAVDEVVIEQPTQVVASSVSSDVTCFNDNNGSIVVTANGGTAPLSILWDNGATTFTIDGLVAGIYSYTVTDANGCSVIGVDTINEPEQLLALIVCQCQLALCPGDCSFTSDLEVFGGTAPYTYLWSDGATTQDRENLCEGFYSVTVTDANGCTFDVLAPPYIWADSIVVTNVTSTNALCYGECNGTASVEAEGGYGDLAIVWSTGDNTFAIADLCAGTYTFTITDAIGCSTEGSVTIGEPEILLAYSECPVLILCPGDCTGVIDVTVIGGTAPYTYLWNDGATTEDREGLCAGLYEVTITDANGCEFVKTHAPFENPAPLEANASSTDDTNCLNPNCDGTASVNPVGGTGAYSIVWSNGSTNASIEGLCVGSYSVTITDANGCSIVDAVEIGCTPPPPCVSPVIEITGNVAPCTSSDEVVLGIGGLDGYSVISYDWSTGANGSSIVVTGSGVYSVTVAVDDSFCLAIDTAVVEYAPLPIVSDESSDVTCFNACNGSASVSVSAITGYTVAWSNEAGGSSIDGLCAGTYTYTVTSDLGCTVAGEVVIGQPTQLEASADSWNVTCFENCDGGATVAINGGTAPYTVAWSTGDFGGELNSLCAGVYTFTVTDAHQCTVVGEVTVDGPDQLLALSSCPTGILCPGECTGSIDVEVFGGTAPYSYNWSNGATTQDISGLCAGQYNVTITDANGCTFELLHAPFVDPAPIVVTVESTDPNCANEWSGSISLTISGGTAPYSIVWNVAYEGTELENLVAGTYCFTVTDANGCTYADCVTLEEPGALLGYVDCPCPISLCPGQCTGEINLTVVGGVAPFSFDWNNGATTEDLTNLCAGAYNVTITDANGCTFDVYHAPIEEAEDCEVIEIAQDLREATAEVVAADDATIKAYPNPFAANSTIEFTVGSDDNVTLEVYSVTGQKVAELFRGNVEANTTYKANLEGANLSAGMYIYRLVTSNGAYTGNIVRVK